MNKKNKTIIDLIKHNNEYFEDYITRSVYHSNAIEGNTLSYYATYQVIFNCSSDEILTNVKPRELYEAINLKYAMDYIFRNLYDDISAKYIIKLGEIINKNFDKIDSFRHTPVLIKGAEHIPPNAVDVPRLINELIFTSFKSNDFIKDLAEFHIRYERIHPFADGNVRTGRVLLNKISLANGYLPFVINKEQRSEYMKLLADCDIIGMANMFYKLMKFEKNRMNEFQIDFSQFTLTV